MKFPWQSSLRSFQSCWTIRALTGPAQAKGYCPVYKARYTTTLIPVLNDRLSSIPRDVLGNSSQSWRQAVKWVQPSLQVHPRPTLAGDLGANAGRKTRANGQQPRSLSKRPRLSYTINRFDTTKYFKMNKDGSDLCSIRTIFAPLGDRPFRRLAAIHRTRFDYPHF